MSKQDSLLNKIEIAKPCSADWDEMTGDERERACQLCHLNVYNISSMSTNEAEHFLRQRLPQGRVCVRLYRRSDGTIITDNCPRGLRAARDTARRLQNRLAAAASLLIAFLGCQPASTQNSGGSKDAPAKTDKIESKIEKLGRVSPAANNTQGPRPLMGEPTAAPSADKGPTPMMGTPAPITGTVCPVKVDMAAYQSKVDAKIRRNWKMPSKADKKIIVLFTINADGSLRNARIDSPSGDRNLDKKALAAVRKAAPFDKLPTMSGESLQTQYTFSGSHGK